MFGLSFLFSAALFALPLAGVPVVLHLLFRRKSPVVEFPTLRFIRASIQRTAARRRVHRWLLLACRALLLALLIWAVAQPARVLNSNWAGGGSIAAAVVIDTSYSMQYQQAGTTLAARAGTIVQDLLRDPLKDARVAVFKSAPADKSSPERFSPATAVLAEWTPPTPQASPTPLVDRVAAAMDKLSHESADQKWLVVLTDGQSREFPHPAGDADAVRTVWFDLHPDVPRSIGVSSVSLEPRSAVAGLNATVPIELTGRAGDAAAVSLEISTPDGKSLGQLPPSMANLDSAGRATVRFPYRLPAEHWLVLNASIPAADEMPWDNARRTLLELPQRQPVRLLTGAATSPAEKYIALALDPTEGKSPAWPLALTRGNLANDNTCVVAAWAAWPDRATAVRLHDLVRGGATVILFLQPGLEDSFAKLDADTKSALLDVLPGTPQPAPPGAAGPWRAAVSTDAASEPLMDGLIDEKFQVGSIVVRQFVPFDASDPAVRSLLRLTSADASPTTKPTSAGRSLVFAKSVGAGRAYTFAAAPDPAVTNLATHPIFLPLLVRMAINAGAPGDVNVELGQPLVEHGTIAATATSLQIVTPSGAVYEVPATNDANGRRFVFATPTEPGLYAWRENANATAIAWSNVQPPAAESQLTYRDAAKVAPTQLADDGTKQPALIVHSTAELQSKIAALAQPEPRWTTPIALVLLLLCVEAFLGSAGRAFSNFSLRSLFVRAAA